MRRWGPETLDTHISTLGSRRLDSVENTISKSATARLKLSKFELKYGKKESANAEYLSEASFGVDATTALSEEDEETEKEIEHRSRHALSQKADSQRGTRGTELAERISNIGKNSSVKLLNVPNESKGDPNKEHQTTTDSIPRHGLMTDTQEIESSLSEIMENVHSFSSLEGKSQLNDQDSVPAGLKQTEITPSKNGLLEVSVPANDPLPSPETTENIASESVDSIQSEINTGTVSFQEESQVLSETFANVRQARDLIFSGAELKSHVKQKQDSLTTPKREQSTRATTITPEDHDSRALASPVLQDTLSSPSKMPEAPENDVILNSSSLTIFTKKVIVEQVKNVSQRDAEVQTERKRSRKVQVNMSTTSSTKEENDLNAEKLSCPIITPVSLPKSMLNVGDEMWELYGGRNGGAVMSVEEVMQDLMKAQIQLTVGLLRRQHALYLSSCGSAAHLERGYHRETLSGTRQFIREEKRLRQGLRSSDEKLLCDG